MFLKRPTEILKSGPNVSTAARVGMPTLTPQSDDATDTLTPGAGLTVVASGGASTGSTGGSGTYVQTVTPAGSGVGDPAVPQPPNAAAGNPATAAGASDAGCGSSFESGQPGRGNAGVWTACTGRERRPAGTVKPVGEYGRIVQQQEEEKEQEAEPGSSATSGATAGSGAAAEPGSLLRASRSKPLKFAKRTRLRSGTLALKAR